MKRASKRRGVRLAETGTPDLTNPAAGSGEEKKNSLESRNEEEAILALLRSGDPQGVERIMEKFHARLFSVAYGICKNHEDVEEVLQDAYMLAASKIDHFEERSRLFTWLYRITVNTALMKRRSNGRRLLTVSLENPEMFAGGEEQASGDYTMEWNQEERVTFQQLQKELSRHVQELPWKYQSVLALRSRGYSIRETSKMLNTTPAAVKSRMHRGRLYLREQLGADLFGIEAWEEGCQSLQ